MEYLLDLMLRTLALAVTGGAVIGLLRLKSAAARHAVWTLVTAGMLVVGASAPLLPSLRWHVLRAAHPVIRTVPARASAVPSLVTEKVPAPVLNPIAPARPAISWQQAAGGIYAAGVLVFLAMLFSSYRFTGRLVRAGRPVDVDVYESNWISVPATVGMLHPKILLPEGWRQWPAEKLEAVMVHERAHVRRGDWALTVMAGLNRSLFWFHPLAWWLERRLAALAEEACDDASLLELGKRQQYAQTLWDMAAAVKTGQGRMVWEAMAMAKTAEVRTRIERILDETRQIPKGVSGRKWAAMAVCGLPLMYVAAALQLAPAQEIRLSPQTVAQLEQTVAARPDNLEARQRLIASYYLAGVKQPRLNHIYWLLENRPESDAASFESAGILNRNTSLNNTADYDRAAALWKQQVAAHASEAKVLGNAGHFFSQPGADLNEAEKLFQQAAALAPEDPQWTEQLGLLYASAITAAEGFPRYDLQTANPNFAEHAKTVLKASADQMLRSSASKAMSPAALAGMPRDAALEHYPQLFPLAALSDQLAGRPTFQANTAYDTAHSVYITTPAVPSGKPAAVFTAVGLGKAPMVKLVQSAAPVYPEAARSAGIEGDVKLDVLVGPDGHVVRAQPLEGNPLLAAAAREAVLQYVYEPTAVVGKGTATRTAVTVPFRLDGASGAQWQTASPRYAPVLLYKKEAGYSQEALAAKLQGTVVVSFTVGTDGIPHDLKVTRSLGLGLDEQATAAVSQWKFKPSTQDGKPVEAPSMASINFQLAESPQPAAPLKPGESRSYLMTNQPAVDAPDTQPVVTFKTEPEYSEEARKARYQGTVVLYVMVGTDGKAGTAKVLRSLGLGLDEKAMEAVAQWRFTPATKNGVAVAAPTTIAMNFRLVDGEQPLIARTEAFQNAPRVDANSPDTQPVAIYQTDPEYSEAARKARYQGTVVLYVMVGTDGKAGTVKVLRSLGLGLDEKAMEAVAQWKFTPATKNGTAVAAATTVTMNFRLL